MEQEKNNLQYRMMGLVPYNLSPIQQGIQYGHAVVEYITSEIHSTFEGVRDPLIKWMTVDKTFIILNGGTTNNKGDHRLGHGGSLNQHLFKLSDAGVKVATFYEPDLGDQLTAVVFLVDERVFDREKYPDLVPTNGLISNIKYQSGYYEWEESVGGARNVWLREFLKQFRLA